MKNDNTTPLSAGEYDRKIAKTIPYYEEFGAQAFDVIASQNFEKMHWLDLGCGTGSLEEKALEVFPEADFVLLDPSESMLRQAGEKLAGHPVQYICSTSDQIAFDTEFDIVTAIQAHHYMHEEERQKATVQIYKALKKGGIYISFENVVPEDARVKERELLRWGSYQQRHGKTAREAREHNSRCGVNYFPITVPEHIALLKEAGFAQVHVFWYSYMQMGIYGIK